MTDKQKYLLLEYLMINRGRFTAMAISSEFNAIHYGRIDWHEIANFLDQLHTKGALTITGHNTSNMCIYELAK